MFYINVINIQLRHRMKCFTLQKNLIFEMSGYSINYVRENLIMEDETVVIAEPKRFKYKNK